MADVIHEWPGSLGAPLVDGYQRTPQSSVIRSQYDVGPAKLRRGMTARPPVNVAAKLLLSKATVQVLEDFYWETLAETGRFYWKDHARPVAAADNIAIYRFREPPPPTPAGTGHWWTATLELERLTTVQGHFLLDFSDGEQGITT